VVDCTALELFERHVTQSPSVLAIKASEGELTYRQLSEKVNRLACLLIEEEIQPGQHVGVCLPNSIELVVAVFAIMKVGCVYVPMNADSTLSKLNYIIEDADIALILLSSELLDTLSSSGTPVLLLEDCADENWLNEYADLACGLPDRPIDEEDLAYVIYTSGTTGQPKGVSILHKSLTNYLLFAQKEYLNNALQGAVLSTPISFDASITTFFTALISGKQLVIASPDKEVTFRELKNYLFESSEDWLFKLTPSISRVQAVIHNMSLSLVVRC
jgi:non-ribosomal peptide synthetase component F